jgi:hypothetical protein
VMSIAPPDRIAESLTGVFSRVVRRSIAAGRRGRDNTCPRRQPEGHDSRLRGRCQRRNRGVRDHARAPTAPFSAHSTSTRSCQECPVTQTKSQPTIQPLSSSTTSRGSRSASCRSTQDCSRTTS